MIKNKVLIFDTDKGLSCLGTDNRIEEVFGYKPRRFIKPESMSKTFDKLFDLYIIEKEDSLGTIEEEVRRLKDKHELDVWILDSFSAYSSMIKHHIRLEEGRNDKMNMDKWSGLGDNTEESLLKLMTTDTFGIVTCHIKPVEDKETGVIRYSAGIQGRMKDEIMRHFDIVAYTYVEPDPETGVRSYKWVMEANHRFYSAKCRIPTVSAYLKKNNGMMDQDFDKLLSLIQDAGYHNTKILILGDPGTGKTFALRTLKEVDFSKSRKLRGESTEGEKYIEKEEALPQNESN